MAEATSLGLNYSDLPNSSNGIEFPFDVDPCQVLVDNFQRFRTTDTLG